MRLYKLLSLAGMECPEGLIDTDITAIAANSKKAVAGSLYICLRGTESDGHDYIDEACFYGASVVVCSGDGKYTVPRGAQKICVENTRDSMARLYSAWYGNPQNDMKIIAVTGTNGKTTTSRMIYEILHRSGRRAGVIGTLGTLCCGSEIDVRSEDKLANLTTPDPEQLYKIFSVMRECGVELVVMEVSSHSLAFSKVSPINFEVGVFTNMTPEHLDFHGDMESYFCAKASLFAQCKRAIVNVDDAYGRRIADAYPEKALGCSTRGNDACVSAEQIKISESGVEYKLSHPRMRARLRCAIPGEFTVMNSLEATVCAYELGVSAQDIKGALEGISGIDGRLERVRLGDGINFSVFIDYAHTPDALENLLRTARGFGRRKQRIVLLFGCGGDRDRYKRAQMGRIASSMADFVIITADNSRSEDTSDIIGEILSGVDKESCFTVIEDREEAIEYAIRNARDNDVILLAGKGHERYEISKSEKKYFCERDLVLKYASKYHHKDDLR